MGKFFPKLNQRLVRLDLCDGKSVDAQMIPVGDIGRLSEFADALDRAATAKETEAVRIRMIEFAKGFIPVEFAPNLCRFNVDMLSELLAYLAFGDAGGDDQPNPEPKKN